MSSSDSSGQPAEAHVFSHAGRYDLRCADADVAGRLRAWLDGAQLAWPGRFEIDVIVSESRPFSDDSRDAVQQPGVRIFAGPPQGTVQIEWNEYPAVAQVHETEPRATLWFSPPAAEHLEDGDRSFLLVTLVFILRRIGWYHVHGAALTDPRGRGWLIAGNSHCGKSTTTALLATRGWQVATDDIGFLAMRDQDAVVLGFRSLIALRPGGHAMLAARQASLDGQVLARRSKQGFHAEELGAVWTPEVTPRIIAFPQLGERTSMERAAPRVALSEIVKWSSWVLYEPGFAQEQLDVLGRLAAQSRCFHLTLGPDLFENPDMLETLVP